MEKEKKYHQSLMEQKQDKEDKFEKEKRVNKAEEDDIPGR